MTGITLKCPTCGRATPASPARHMPFCSERCRLIDLGRWLEEEHAVATGEPDEKDESPRIESGADDRPPVRLPPGWHDA